MKDLDKFVGELVGELAYWNARQEIEERITLLKQNMEAITANEELINMLAENRRMAAKHGLVCPPDDVA